MANRRVIIGMTGATGTILGVRLLEMLREASIETHLVMTRWAVRTLLYETSYSKKQVEALATVVHHPADLGASIASGSFVTQGMIIAPCSVRSLAAIAHGYGEQLVHRAADVTLKERRRLVLCVREMPLSAIHLDNMLTLARSGAIVCPPVPGFYMKPQSIDDMVTHICHRLLDQVGVTLGEADRWTGEMAAGD